MRLIMRYKGSLQSIPEDMIFCSVLADVQKKVVCNILLLIYYFPLNLELKIINSNVLLLWSKQKSLKGNWRENFFLFRTVSPP